MIRELQKLKDRFFDEAKLSDRFGDESISPDSLAHYARRDAMNDAAYAIEGLILKIERINP
jgi:hypothetical protein